MERIEKLRFFRYSIIAVALASAFFFQLFWPKNLLPEYHIPIILYAIIFGSFLGDFIIHPICRLMKSSAERENDNNDGVTFSSSWLGMVERGIYVSSWLVGFPQFIAVWLTLKTVSKWGRWNDDKKGRAAFLVFLTGTGLSLLFATLVAVIALEIIKK